MLTSVQRRVAEQQYERVRFAHAKVVSTMQVKSAPAFEPARHACEAAESASGVVVHYSGNWKGRWTAKWLTAS
tara:strand:- start:706 stop:924 length:219 start_codon:yes stop_codon:yes gene_type:complete